MENDISQSHCSKSHHLAVVSMATENSHKIKKFKMAGLCRKSWFNNAAKLTENPFYTVQKAERMRKKDSLPVILELRSTKNNMFTIL